MLPRILIATLLLAPVPVVRSEQYDEYTIKAALLYNFTRFIHWPTDSLSPRNRHYRICVYGPDPYGYRLDALEDRPRSDITVYRYELLNDALTGCQILFISELDDRRVKSVTKFLVSHPILTVGESENFILSGGMVGLVREEDTVKFEINLRTVNAAGLEMSSQLLRIATRVIRNPVIGEPVITGQLR
jgi:hypothetical protein